MYKYDEYDHAMVDARVAEFSDQVRRRLAGETTPQGPRPAHIKDRIRALGPTVRPDLTLKPADPAAGDWVI